MLKIWLVQKFDITLQNLSANKNLDTKAQEH